MYGPLDVIPEWGKALGDELAKADLTTEREFMLIERYLAVADSVSLYLSQFRHTPGYVINNAFGHWAAFTSKLRTADFTISVIRRDYGVRRSNLRMHMATIRMVDKAKKEMLEALEVKKILTEALA
jgi:hypothetical protein